MRRTRVGTGVSSAEMTLSRSATERAANDGEAAARCPTQWTHSSASAPFGELSALRTSLWTRGLSTSSSDMHANARTARQRATGSWEPKIFCTGFTSPCTLTTRPSCDRDAASTLHTQ
jgi:hypothetical protein